MRMLSTAQQTQNCIHTKTQTSSHSLTVFLAQCIQAP